MFRLDLLQDQDFQNILLVSRVESKLNRKLCKETDLNASMDKLVNQGMILNVSLRIQGEILLGIVRIYNKKVELFINDATVVLKNLQKALKQALQSTPDAIDARDKRDITLADIFEDDQFLQDMPANFLFGEITTDDEQVEAGPLLLDSQARRQKRESQEQLYSRMLDLDELPSQEQMEQAERECEQLLRSFAAEDGLDDVVRAQGGSPDANLNEGILGSPNQQQNTSSRSKDQDFEPNMDLIPDDPMQVDQQEMDQQLHDQDMEGGVELIPEQLGDEDINYQQQPQQEEQHANQEGEEPQPPPAQAEEQQEEEQGEEDQQVGREYVGRKRRAVIDLDTDINRVEQRQLLQNRESLLRPRQRLMLKRHKNLDKYSDADYLGDMLSINQNQAPALCNLYERMINASLRHQLYPQRIAEQEQEQEQDQPELNFEDQEHGLDANGDLQQPGEEQPQFELFADEEFDVRNMEVVDEEQPAQNGHVQEEEDIGQPPLQEEGSSSMQEHSNSLGVQFSGLGKQGPNGNEEIEQEVDPSTGFTKQTQIVHDNLKSVFSKQGQEGLEGSIGIYKLLQGRDRLTAARVFFETLALQNKGYIRINQQSSDADIFLQPTQKLMGVYVEAGQLQQQNMEENIQNVTSQEEQVVA